jgi:hypothetical protein
MVVEKKRAGLDSRLIGTPRYSLVGRAGGEGEMGNDEDYNGQALL